MEMNFDPMTGQPIQQEMQAPVYTMPPGKKKKHGLALGISIAAVVIAACGVTFAGVRNGLFLSKSAKVAMATANTFSETSYLTQSFKGLDILATKSYTMNFDMDMGDEVSFDTTYACTSSEKQIFGSVDFPYDDNVEFVVGIDDEEVKAQIPTLGDDVYVYNYTKEKTGYLAEQLEKKEIESIDELCKTIYSGKEQTKQGAELAKIFSDEYKSLTFKNAQKQTFEVDGKDRKCKGYETTVTKETVKDLLNKLEDYTKDQFGETLDDTMDIRDSFDEARDAYEDLQDADIAFYIYKNKLACVDLKSDSNHIQIIFHGGDRRTQNVEMLVNDKTQLEIKGETDGKKEETRLYVAGNKVASLEYDYDNGKYTLSVDGYGDFDGILKTGRQGFEFTLNNPDISIKMNLCKGAELRTISGNKFDIGNASESEIEELTMKAIGIDPDYGLDDDYDWDYDDNEL